MADRGLALTDWEMTRADAGSIDDPGGLKDPRLQWTAATVPGTAAGALRAAHAWDPEDRLDFDASDWWLRTTFASPGRSTARLRFGGIATVGEVWCNGQRVLETDNMFVEHVVEIPLREHNEIVVCCRSLQRHLAIRRPRPRWKTRLVESQQLRWVRTTLLGRMPSWTPPSAPVGLWRPVEVLFGDREQLRLTGLRSRLEGTTGVTDVSARGDGLPLPESAELVVGDVVTPLAVEGDDIDWTASCTAWHPGRHALVPVDPRRADVVPGITVA